MQIAACLLGVATSTVTSSCASRRSTSARTLRPTVSIWDPRCILKRVCRIPSLERLCDDRESSNASPLASFSGRLSIIVAKSETGNSESEIRVSKEQKYTQARRTGAGRSRKATASRAASKQPTREKPSLAS